MIVQSVTETHLVHGHHEGVNVTLFRGVAVREVELCWVQQFWGHITDNPWFGCCRATWLYDSGVGNHTRDPEVPKTCNTILTNQDVSLDRTNVGACPKLRTRSALTGLISLCMMFSECRYSRPPAACASYRGPSLKQSVYGDDGDRLPVLIYRSLDYSRCTRGYFRLVAKGL